MFGLNPETIFISLVVCGLFLLVTNFLQDESKHMCGITQGVVETISYSMNFATTAMLILVFFVMIGYITNIFSGGRPKERRVLNKIMFRLGVDEH